MPMMLIGTGGADDRERDLEARLRRAARARDATFAEIGDPEQVARRDPREVTPLPPPQRASARRRLSTSAAASSSAIGARSDVAAQHRRTSPGSRSSATNSDRDATETATSASRSTRIGSASASSSQGCASSEPFERGPGPERVGRPFDGVSHVGPVDDGHILGVCRASGLPPPRSTPSSATSKATLGASSTRTTPPRRRAATSSCSPS